MYTLHSKLCFVLKTSERFQHVAKISFSRNFANAKFCEIKTLAKIFEFTVPNLFYSISGMSRCFGKHYPTNRTEQNINLLKTIHLRPLTGNRLTHTRLVLTTTLCETGTFLIVNREVELDTHNITKYNITKEVNNQNNALESYSVKVKKTQATNNSTQCSNVQWIKS